MADAKLTIKELPTAVTVATDADLLALWDDSDNTTSQFSVADLKTSVITPLVAAEAVIRAADDVTLQNNIDLKADIDSPTLTGIPLAPTATNGTDTDQLATTAFVQDAVSSVTGAVVSVNGDTGAVVLDASSVGLGGFAGLTPATLPLSTAETAALATKEPNITGGTTSQYWRGDKTFQPTLGLPISTATQAALDAKVENAVVAGHTTIAPSGDAVNTELLRRPVYVSTRSAMKALSTTLYSSCILTEAGRDGTFTLNTGSPPVTDTQEGIYIVSNTAGFYWTRIYAPRLYPSATVFGALGNTTDDSVAIQAAINVCGTADLTPGGSITSWTFGNITMANQANMVSAVPVTVFSTALVGGYVVRVVCFSVAKYSQINNIQFDLAAADDASTAIRFGTSTQIVFGFISNNCSFKNCGEAIGDEVHATNYVVDITFNNALCFLTRAQQVYIKRSRGFMNFYYFKIDHTYNTGQVTWRGMQFADVVGLELEKITVVGPVSPTPTYQAAAYGIYITGAIGGGALGASVWLRRIEVDNTRGPAIYVNGIKNLYIINTTVYQNLGQGIELVGCSEGFISDTLIYGASGLTGAAAGAHGLTMTSCLQFNITNLNSRLNTGWGFICVSGTDILTSNSTFQSNLSWGVGDFTAATRCIRSNIISTGNTSGSLTQLTGATTVNWIPNSGTFTASTTGTTTVP